LLCCALQADGLLQRHSHLPLVNEAAAVLVHASKNGPAALQVGDYSSMVSEKR
jgi:hypothetical protein